MSPTKAKNTFGIPFLRTGPANLVAVINQILAALDSLRVVQGGEVTPQGTLIRPGSGGTSRRARSTEYPLDLSLIDAGATFTGVFRPGTLNGKLPSNYNALTGISKTGVVFIVLTGTMNNGQPTSCVFSTSGTAPDAPSVNQNLPPLTLPILTHIVADGVVFRVLGPSSITATVVESFRVEKASPAPGERTFNSFYTYEVSSG